MARAGRTNSKDYGLKKATKPKETRSNLENGELLKLSQTVTIRNLFISFYASYLCVSVKLSLKCSVLSSVQKSVCVQLSACFCVIEDVQ